MYVLLFANNSPRVCRTFVLIIKAYVALHEYVLCTKRQECAYSLIFPKPEPSFGPREICLLNGISLIHFKRGWPRVKVNINSLQKLQILAATFCSFKTPEKKSVSLKNILSNYKNYLTISVLLKSYNTYKKVASS